MNIIKMYNSLQALNPKNCNTEDSLPQTCQFDHSFIEETVKALKSNNVSERDMEKLC